MARVMVAVSEDPDGSEAATAGKSRIDVFGYYSNIESDDFKTVSQQIANRFSSLLLVAHSEAVMAMAVQDSEGENLISDSLSTEHQSIQSIQFIQNQI